MAGTLGAAASAGGAGAGPAGGAPGAVSDAGGSAEAMDATRCDRCSCNDDGDGDGASTPLATRAWPGTGTAGPEGGVAGSGLSAAFGVAGPAHQVAHETQPGSAHECSRRAPAWPAGAVAVLGLGGVDDCSDATSPAGAPVGPLESGRKPAASRVIAGTTVSGIVGKIGTAGVANGTGAAAASMLFLPLPPLGVRAAGDAAGDGQANGCRASSGLHRAIATSLTAPSMVPISTTQSYASASMLARNSSLRGNQEQQPVAAAISSKRPG